MSFQKKTLGADQFIFGRQGPPGIYGQGIRAHFGATCEDGDGCYDELRGLGNSEVALRLPWWMWLAGAGGAWLWLKKRRK